MFTSVMMPQETFANDPATDPWATALCTLLSLGGSLPMGEVCCLPAQLIQACQGNPGTTVWPSLMSTYCAHHSELCRQALILIFSSSGLPWIVLPRLSQLCLTTCGDILDSCITLFGLSMVTLMWISDENTASLKMSEFQKLSWPSWLWLLFSSALMKVEQCQAGWTILPSAPGCHTSDDSPPSVWTLRDLTVFSTASLRA